MANNDFNYPLNHPVLDNKGLPTMAWAQVFTRWQTIIASEQQSGTTAQRPAKGLWIGRRYFDTTLGYPIYVKSVNPAVWVDGSGAVK